LFFSFDPPNLKLQKSVEEKVICHQKESVSKNNQPTTTTTKKGRKYSDMHTKLITAFACSLSGWIKLKYLLYNLA
jgi:hypothetical protein